MQNDRGLQPCCTVAQPFTARGHLLRGRCWKPLQIRQPQDTRAESNATSRIRCSAQRRSSEKMVTAGLSSGLTLWLLSELPALAEQKDFSQGGGFAKESYYVTLGLFLLSLPGTFPQLPLQLRARMDWQIFTTYSIRASCNPLNPF